MPNLPLQLTRTLLSRKNASGLLAVTICAGATLALTPAAVLADDGQSLWTQFAPSQDTRLIFVSSSEGNDSNSGLNPNEPVKSLARAYALLRDGYPDWMLLKRGDVWNSKFPRWKKSGRDENERLIVGAYGDAQERPQVRPPSGSTAVQGWGNDTVSHVAFVGLHLEPKDRQAQDGGAGISWLKNSDDILFEDLYIGGFDDNMVLQAHPASNVLSNFRLNGCVIVDAWSTISHSQGLFASGVDGLIIENSVFDGNGHNIERNAPPTIFNHNIYVQNGVTNIHVRNNIIADASSHGIQMRGGGIAENNLFISNPLAIHVGGGNHPDEGGVTSLVHNNLIMYGRDLDANTPRSFGITLSNIKQADVTSNYLYKSSLGYNHDAFRIGGDRGLMVKDLNVSNNVLIDWNGSINIPAPVAGQILKDISISNNMVFRDLEPSSASSAPVHPVTRVFHSWQDIVEFSNNSYYLHNPSSTPFRVGNSSISASNWNDNVEPNGIISITSSAPPNLGIETYLAHHEANGDFQNFVERARQLSRQSWDSKYTSLGVINWFADQISNESLTP